MSRNPYAYPPEHRRYDPGDPHGRKLDGDFRKRLDRALDRQLALENQVRAVLADYPISDQVQGLLDLLVGMARTGRGYDLETLIATKEEAGRDKDLAVLPTLRATLAEIRRRTVETSTTSGCG